jgi:hypothetical protein
MNLLRGAHGKIEAILGVEHPAGFEVNGPKEPRSKRSELGMPKPLLELSGVDFYKCKAALYDIQYLTLVWRCFFRLHLGGRKTRRKKDSGERYGLHLWMLS